jgi:hypothetical protein
MKLFSNKFLLLFKISVKGRFYSIGDFSEVFLYDIAAILYITKETKKPNFMIKILKIFGISAFPGKCESSSLFYLQ